MREIIYYSTRAVTSGTALSKLVRSSESKGGLMKAGRMDIACQMVIMSLFVSNKIRENVNLHLVFHGGPDPPKHLEIYPGKNIEETSPESGISEKEVEEKRVQLSKKDIASLIKKMLYKHKKEKEKTEFAPGYYIEKKSFIEVVHGFLKNGKKVYVLEKRGGDIRKKSEKELEDCVFIIGDEEGIPKKELKKIKSLGAESLSVGNETYFASQTTTIIHNELDRRGIE